MFGWKIYQDSANNEMLFPSSFRITNAEFPPYHQLLLGKIENNQMLDYSQITYGTASGIPFINIENIHSVHNKILGTANTFNLIPVIELKKEYLEKYNITKKDTENGSFVINSSEQYVGDKVNITISPKNNYQLDKIKVLDLNNNEIDVINNSFVMPRSDVTVDVTFKPINNNTFEYKIIEGSNQEYCKGKSKGLIIKSNGDISKFVELRVDAVFLDTINYTIESGSTIAILKSSYLDRLPDGEHILSFIYNDGEVSTKFIISKNDVAGIVKSPKTGDNIIEFIIIFIISLFGITTLKVKNCLNSRK